MSVQVLLVVFALSAFVYFLSRKKHLPPGPWRLPVIGSSIQLYLVKTKLPYVDLSKIGEKYGDIFSFGFGNKLAVMVTSYDGTLEIFKLNVASINRFDMPFVEDRNFGKNLGIGFASGQNWIDVRTFTKKVLREFGYGKVKIMDKLFNESAIQIVDAIKTSLLDSRDGTLAVENSKFSIYVFNIVWAMIGGYKFEPDDESLTQVMKCLDKALEVYGMGNIYNTFPFMKKWFPKLVNYPEHLKIHEEIHGFSKFLIDNATEKRSERLDATPISFIEVFLDKIDEEQGNPESIFTMEQLQITVDDLFLASMETTGNLLSWAILFMVINPDKQNKVRQVIVNKGANTRILSAAELKQIPYVMATILEILRKGNVVPIPPARFSAADIKFREFIIPKGTILLNNLYSMYNDKAFWKDPETFRPERFLNDNGEIDLSTSERILNTVFGVGSRVCFGELIGLGSLYTIFGALIANFQFESIPGQKPSAENCHFGLTNSPDEFNVKVTKLSI